MLLLVINVKMGKSRKEVSEKDIEKSLKAIKEDFCFKCSEHNDKCTITKAAGDIKAMK